jgi:hypothetical protein
VKSRPAGFVIVQTDGKELELRRCRRRTSAAALSALNIEQVPFTATDGNVEGYARTTVDWRKPEKQILRTSNRNFTAVHHYEYQSDPTMARRYGRRNAESAFVNNATHASGHSRTHKAWQHCEEFIMTDAPHSKFGVNILGFFQPTLSCARNGNLSSKVAGTLGRDEIHLRSSAPCALCIVLCRWRWAWRNSL